MVEFIQDYADGMDGEAKIVEYVNDAQEALRDSPRCDTCMASHAVDYALAIIFKNSVDASEAKEHLTYVINELRACKSAIERNT